MSDHSEMLDAEETSLAAVIDDSYTVEYVEIVTLHSAPDDSSVELSVWPEVETNLEDVQDVKQEPADEDNSGDTHYHTKVRFSMDIFISHAPELF